MKLTIDNPNSLFFTSDPHFGHRKMAEMRCPGMSIEQHDELLLDNAARTLSEHKGRPHLVITGDLSMVGTKRTNAVLERLAKLATLHLVRGNHDKSLTESSLAYFKTVSDILTVKVTVEQTPDEVVVQRIVCCHFPMLAWDMQHHGAWHVHGHSHGSCRYPNANAKMIDVGVDPMNLAPVSFRRLQVLMLHKEVWSPDHHRVRSPSS